MFWTDSEVNVIREQYRERIAADEPLIIRDEKTPSGRVHFGSMLGVALHGVVSEVLSEDRIGNIYRFEFNDFDPMDDLPADLSGRGFEQYMGQPLYTVPAPDDRAENFAAYYAEEFKDAITDLGFYPEFYNASDLYRRGDMNTVIRLALEHKDTIRSIYQRVSKSEKPADWYPLQVVCESCGKIGTTKVTHFDGKQVTYQCLPDLVSWATGCGREGTISPFDGRAKMPFKVEWAAKFAVLNVHVEGGGKDHATKGGTRDVANAIAREVFSQQPPHDIPYEFILVGGKKMSSSKGRGVSAREIVDMVPPEIARLALVGKKPSRQKNFDPHGDTIPVLFDTYDQMADKYFEGIDDDDARAFPLLHPPEDRETLMDYHRPRFSHIASLLQLPHVDLYEELGAIKGAQLTDVEKQEADYRAAYAQSWLDHYAPEEFKLHLYMDEPPITPDELTPQQREALARVRDYIAQQDSLDGQQLHTALHDIRKEMEIEPKAFFSALYLAFLGKESGPKAGWFLSVLERDLLLHRLAVLSRTVGT
jgi:lysyl-tRNA synthetase class 1